MYRIIIICITIWHLTWSKPLLRTVAYKMKVKKIAYKMMSTFPFHYQVHENIIFDDTIPAILYFLFTCKIDRYLAGVTTPRLCRWTMTLLWYPMMIFCKCFGTITMQQVDTAHSIWVPSGGMAMNRKTLPKLQRLQSKQKQSEKFQQQSVQLMNFMMQKSKNSLGFFY